MSSNEQDDNIRRWQMPNSAPKYKFKFKIYRCKHTTDSIWCWCDPIWLTICCVCGGQGARQLFGDAECKFCHLGMVVSTSPDNVDQTIHRDTRESPFDFRL